MSWRERLSEAAYTSPGGTRIRFYYDDVSTEVDKRTAAFEFPGTDGAYVQDNGHGERRYPLRCIFSGSDCDLEASAFESLLLERGTGRLDHPLYGRVDVVPFGNITRRDDLATASNQTIVEVVFWATLGAVYPTSRTSPRHELIASTALAHRAVGQRFEQNMDLETEIRRENTKLTIAGALRHVQAALGVVIKATESVNREFRDVQQQVNFGIDVLIGQPLLLAGKVLDLVNAPARALTGIASRLEAYAALLARMIESSKSAPGDLSVLSRVQLRLSNDFHTSHLVASGAVLGSIASVLAHQFTAKPQAIEAAEAILARADALTAWQDGRFDDLGQIDTGEGSRALAEAVALAVGYLVEISFSLVPERAVVLDRPRGLVELCGELYGSVGDARLDFLIGTNRLTGSEILELPRGRRVVYYD